MIVEQVYLTILRMIDWLGDGVSFFGKLDAFWNVFLESASGNGEEDQVEEIGGDDDGDLSENEGGHAKWFGNCIAFFLLSSHDSVNIFLSSC